MILVSCFNVYPNEIESIAVMHPGVPETAAIAQADEKSGEVVALFVVKKAVAITKEDRAFFIALGTRIAELRKAQSMPSCSSPRRWRSPSRP
jgi:acyl-CoA synthetase (AMP-forming)/AMP-acid ligase II